MPLATRRRIPFYLLTLALFVVGAAETGSSRPPTDSIRFEVKMDDAMAQLWYDMPQSSMSQNVQLSGNTQPDCADAALRKARVALTWVGVQDAARRAAVQTLDIAKDIFEHAFGIGWAGYLGDAIGLYLESGSVDELADNLKKLAAEKAGQAVAGGASAGAGAVGGRTTGAASTAAGAVSHGLEGYPAEKGAGELAKFLWGRMNAAGDKTLFESTFNDPLCGPIAVVFEMRSAPNGRKSIHFRASGDCQCKWPENVPRPMKLGRFTVVGNGELIPQRPEVDGTTIVIKYRLGPTTYDVLASCGCPEGESQTSANPGTGSGTSVQPEPPKTPVYERICWQRCGDLWSRWQELQREANRLSEAAQNLERELQGKQRELAQDEGNLQQAQSRLNAANERLGKYNTPRLQQLFHNQYIEVKRAQENATEEVSRLQNRVDRLRREVNDLQQTAQRLRDAANRRAAEAAAARDAYYRCVASCYEQAMQAGELNRLPDDVQEWKRTHPDPPPPPTETQQASNVLIGVVIGNDTRTGEKTTARVVADPKPFRSIPGLRVIEMTTRVAIGKNGKPDVDTLQARIGEGPAQSCSKPLTGTVPSNAKTVRVSVGQPGGTPATGEVPVVPGQPRTPPMTVDPKQFRTPAALQRGTVGVVQGPFDGNNLGTSVMVGGRPAEIIAETNGALYFAVPGNLQPGQTAVVVEEQGVKMKFKVACVGLQLAAGRLQIEKGESASFTATVTGADGLPASAWQSSDANATASVIDMKEVQQMAPKFRPPAQGAPGMVLLLLQNMSPEIVSMSGGQVVKQELNQGSFSGGPYTYQGSVGAHQRGTFQIKGTVVPFLAPVAGEHTR